MNDNDLLDFPITVLGLVAVLVFMLSFQGVRDHLFDVPPQTDEIGWPAAL